MVVVETVGLSAVVVEVGVVDVVVSWGVADFDSHAGFAEALARADAAMYACKVRRKAVAVG